MEVPVLIILKYVVEVLLLPALAIIGWIAKRLVTRVENVEQRVSELDKHIAVHESIISDMHMHVTSIDKKLDKIIEKLYSRTS